MQKLRDLRSTHDADRLANQAAWVNANLISSARTLQRVNIYVETGGIMLQNATRLSVYPRLDVCPTCEISMPRTSAVRLGTKLAASMDQRTPYNLSEAGIIVGTGEIAEVHIIRGHAVPKHGILSIFSSQPGGWPSQGALRIQLADDELRDLTRALRR